MTQFIIGLVIIVLGIILTTVGTFVAQDGWKKINHKNTNTVIENRLLGQGGVSIEKIEAGGNVNINVINYNGGLPQSPNLEMKRLFENASTLFASGEYIQAIDGFKKCLKLVNDHKNSGALNLQIGNSYYHLRKYLKAVEYYSIALKLSRKAKDHEGEAAAQASIANTYLLRKATSDSRGENIQKAVKFYTVAIEFYKKDEYPVQYAEVQNNMGNAYKYLPAATSEERTKNLRKAINCYRAALEIRRKDEYPVEYAETQSNLGIAYSHLPAPTSENIRESIKCYQEALEIYKKDEYPVNYATTQNSLGAAFANLPGATSEERIEHVRKAIECFREAIEIHKKDEYPQSYCLAAANMGQLLALIEDEEACYWLREAYSLKEYLQGQGKYLEELMEKVCKE
ncbi:MAG: tetratricopeptide repeat protein [Planctomycetes bacterium]|nr:tetratricopeptide repeat protein [Planctomycetota bacterium]